MDENDDAPLDEMNALQAMLDALPLDWVTPSLFPEATHLVIPGGQDVVLSWPGREDDDQVRVGRISLAPNSPPVTIETRVSRLGTGAPPPIPTCTQSLGGSAGTRATRAAVASSFRTTLTLKCNAGTNRVCELVFDEGPAALSDSVSCKT